MTATSDTGTYQHHFHYGILNAAGGFWSTLAFESEEAARQYIRAFWGNDTDTAKRCLRRFKIVPVRVQLTSLAPEHSEQSIKEVEEKAND